MAEQALAGDDSPATQQSGWLQGRLPDAVMRTLTPEQRQALAAAPAPTWGSHSLNIRLSLPWIGRRFYITVVGGPERRDPERRSTDRRLHPLRTAVNALFFLGVAVLFYAVLLVGLALHTAILDV